MGTRYALRILNMLTRCIEGFLGSRQVNIAERLFRFASYMMQRSARTYTYSSFIAKAVLVEPEFRVDGIPQLVQNLAIVMFSDDASKADSTVFALFV